MLQQTVTKLIKNVIENNHCPRRSRSLERKSPHLKHQDLIQASGKDENIQITRQDIDLDADVERGSRNKQQFLLSFAKSLLKLSSAIALPFGLGPL